MTYGGKLKAGETSLEKSNACQCSPAAGQVPIGTSDIMVDIRYDSYDSYPHEMFTADGDASS